MSHKSSWYWGGGRGVEEWNSPSIPLFQPNLVLRVKIIIVKIVLRECPFLLAGKPSLPKVSVPTAIMYMRPVSQSYHSSFTPQLHKPLLPSPLFVHYLYSSLCPYAITMSVNSFITVSAHLFISCSALRSFGFSKPWPSENLKLQQIRMKWSKTIKWFGKEHICTCTCENFFHRFE